MCTARDTVVQIESDGHWRPSSTRAVNQGKLLLYFCDYNLHEGFFIHVSKIDMRHAHKCVTFLALHQPNFEVFVDRHLEMETWVHSDSHQWVPGTGTGTGTAQLRLAAF